MGGWGSGRHDGAPVAEECYRVDLPWMIRNGRATPGSYRAGTLSWSCGSTPSGSISYTADMTDPEEGRLILSYTQGSGSDAKKVEQIVRLVFTRPQYGGKRWWMICPYHGHRVSTLYLPRNGDRFASRKAWRVQYKSQRVADRDKPFEALFRIQRRLGCDEGWEQPIRRPKGMWHRTYNRLEDQYWQTSDECTAQMMAMIGLPDGRVDRTKKRGKNRR